MSSIYTVRKSTDYLVVHCSATPPTMDIGASTIRQWHREKGWIDIGYHFVIRRDGTVEPGRPENVVGAHVEGHNSNSIGICMVGGTDAKMKAQDNFTPAQYHTLALKLRELRAKYPNTVVQGHRDFPNVHKDCPSFDVRKWINETGVFDTSHVPAEPDARSVEITSATPTIYSLAKKYGTTVDAILKVNPHVEPTKLKLGQVIRLPD